MNEIKISMLGISGSGKTAFLSGICDTFISGNIEVIDKKNNNDSHLFKILPYYADNLSETSVGDIRRYSIRNNRGFTSVSTENTKKYMLNIHDDCYDTSNPLCTISFIDYKGGFIEKLVNEHSDDDVKDVRNELLKSNVILIFVDAIRLSSCTNAGQYSQSLGNDDINTFFNTNKFDNKKMTILFVLTKDDSPDVSTDDEILIDRLMHAFETSVKIIERNKWNLGIVRTSAVGRNVINRENNKINPDAEIRPYGIDTVLFYSIYRTISEEVTDICLKINDMEKANVITKMSKEYKNKMKIFRLQMEQTDEVLKYIKIPYNSLRISQNLIWEQKKGTTGISAVNES